MTQRLRTNGTARKRAGRTDTPLPRLPGAGSRQNAPMAAGRRESAAWGVAPFARTRKSVERQRSETAMRWELPQDELIEAQAALEGEQIGCKRDDGGAKATSAALHCALGSRKLLPARQAGSRSRRMTEGGTPGPSDRYSGGLPRPGSEGTTADSRLRAPNISPWLRWIVSPY